ncbi:hypothetical protein [Botrimarina sp.]|uniref:hypothetical protein n=1 Tax=Botrimarina sp. TaxID=2795802 RepID=UPI0032EF69BB
MRTAAESAAAAAANGCTPDEFESHLDWWIRHRDLWRSPEGVLAARLSRLQPGDSASNFWPPFDPDREQRRRRDRERGKPGTAEELRHKRDREIEQLRRREAVRPQLAAMTPAELAAFEREAIPDERQRRELSRMPTNWREDALLDALAARQTEAVL